MAEVPHPPRPRSRRRRTLLALLAGVTALLALTAYLLPFLLKRYIEAHSEEWIGRKVTIRSIVLNPFTLTYGIQGLQCSERGSQETFVAWEELSLKCDLWRGLMDRDWRLRHVRLRDPYVHIEQAGDRFNFSDLLEMGGPDSSAAQDAATVRFSLEDLRLERGQIQYGSDLLKQPIGISELRLFGDRITSGSDRMNFTVGLVVDAGGALEGAFTIDIGNEEYAIDASLDRFALAPLLPYLQDLMHTKALQGQLALTLRLKDSWTRQGALAVSGDLRLNGLTLTDAADAPLLELKQGELVLDTLRSDNGMFTLSRVLLDGLKTRYQMWADGSDTWSRVLKTDSTADGDSMGTAVVAAPANIFAMLADYVRILGQGFVLQRYTADSLSISDLAITFEDHTPEQPFRYVLTDVDVHASRITTATGTADLHATAALNARGRLKSTFRFNPKEPRNVEARLEVQDLSLTDLDAYSRWYGAYPILSGSLSYTGTTSIQEGRLDSKNHLMVDDLRFGKRITVHDTGITVLPLRLGASLLRDVHGRIDLDIPVEGDLNDPEFKPWPIVWQVLGNLVVKAAAAPVRLVAGAFGGEGEEQAVEEVRFTPLQTAVGKEQAQALGALAETLKEKPELIVALVPCPNGRAEQEAWAVRAAKMEHLGIAYPLAYADSLRMESLSLRDSSFTAFLDARTPGSKGMPETERCMTLGAASAAGAVQRIQEQRRAAVSGFLRTAGVADGRWQFRQDDPDEGADPSNLPCYRFLLDVAP
jgi:hypothetical protein